MFMHVHMSWCPNASVIVATTGVYQDAITVNDTAKGELFTSDEALNFLDRPDFAHTTHGFCGM